MLEPIKNSSPPYETSINQFITLSSAFVKFCEKMGETVEIKDFLMTLQAQIPKKLKAGEILLFYKSKQLGLRRAYIRSRIFYEEEVQNLWPQVNKIQSSDVELNLYLASEMGRPFSKTLIVPLNQKTNSKEESTALLFIEIKDSKVFIDLKDFFDKACYVLQLIFVRVLLNTNFFRISYLWSQVFDQWWEPLSIIKNFKVLKFNESFKKIFSSSTDFLKEKNLSKLLEIRKKIYKLHYYPISQMKDLEEVGIVYCQDMTKQFQLKEQLFQSEKMASLCELGENLAHQLNNPLTGVQSMSQILSQNPKLKTFESDFIEIEKACQRSQKIIKNLQAFSQAKSQLKNCDLNQIIQDTLPLLKNRTQGLELRLKLFKQPVEVKGDFSIFQQVAYNLILNSCQALKEDTKKESGYIEISTSKISENRACLKIYDNGPGIPEKNLEKIFQALWTNKKQGLGTGLGLSITQQFVKKFGGKISVSSEEEKFACFTVVLPLSSS